MFHLSDSIVKHFGSRPKNKGSLTYAVENSPMGTAGGVKALEDKLESTFVVCNGDIYSDLDLTAAVNFHREKKAIATIVLTWVDDPSAYGMVETDNEGKILRFVEKPSSSQITTNWVNAGTYILEPEALGYVPGGVSLMFERDLFPNLLEYQKPVYSYAANSYWIDVGSPENYKKLHQDILLGRAPDNLGTRSLFNGLNKGIGCKVADNLRSLGPVLLGDECVIGENVELVGPLVIGDKCNIGTDVSISDSILLDNVFVGEGSRVTECVLGSRSSIRAGTNLPRGSIVPEDTVY
jgi:mannose-1-phosphate guanylyltransferase